MNRRTLAIIGLAAAALWWTAPPPAAGQAEPETGAWRTAWGEPDISGAFTMSSVVPLERPRELGDREFYTPEEAAALEARRMAAPEAPAERERGTVSDVHYDFGQFGLSQYQNRIAPNLRTSIVTVPANGRIPELLDAAVVRRDARADARRGREFDGPENRSLTERCIVWSSTLPPILPGGYNSNLHIFQSPGYVVIQAEMGDPRIIPTDGREPLPGDLEQWNGISVGRWEGDTLVIETTNFHDETAWRNASRHMRVTERLTRLDEDTVEYRFMVSDPETWAEPWGGVYPLTNLDGLLYEYACHEGNYGIANILAGQRLAEAEAAGQ